MYYSSGQAQTINAAVVTRVGPPLVDYPAQPVTGITATRALLSATVDPNGADTTYTSEYGTSTSYGNTTDYVTIPATRGRQTVSATLTGLAPSTTYHVRIDAGNAPGETNGADKTFTTLALRCRLRRQRDHGWEVALAHTKTSTAAAGTLARAHRVARRGVAVEPTVSQTTRLRSVV
jgi:hypothetical protein